MTPEQLGTVIKTWLLFCQDSQRWTCYTYFEGVFINCLNDLNKGYFGGERVSVVDDRFSFISIPTVQLNTAAAMIQRSKRETIVREP